MRQNESMYDGVANTFRSFADTVGIIRRKRWQPLQRAMRAMQEGFTALRATTAQLHEVVLERVRINEALAVRHRYNVVDVYARAGMFRKGGTQ